MTTLNNINVINDSGLDPDSYAVWVAGFMADASNGAEFQVLQADGSFATAATGAKASFINVSNGLTIKVPNVTNSGNNRLFFTVTEHGTTPADLDPSKGYTAYPFTDVPPGVAPNGPYDIFEFGPNAQYDVSAVDSFGMNLSFTVTGDTLTYGARPAVSRSEIASAFSTFMSSDPHGSAFAKLLFTSPTGSGYPQLIDNQFSAIVAPKDWLAIHPHASGLNGYWADTISDVFTSGNQLKFYLNGATVGHYSGSCDDVKYTLSGPGGLTIYVPKSDFEGNQPFIQAVRGPQVQATASTTLDSGKVSAISVTKAGSNYTLPPTVTIAPPQPGGTQATATATVANGKVTSITVVDQGSGYITKPTVTVSVETTAEYQAFGQIEAAMFEAFSRGVILDGVAKAGDTISDTYSSDAWTNTTNWYSDHDNSYNQKASLYDAYAKFFHTCTADGSAGTDTIFGQASDSAFAMAYGFSLDESPNVGSTALGIPPGSWPASQNVPSKTDYNVGTQDVAITIGPWLPLFTVHSTQSWQNTNVSISGSLKALVKYISGSWTANPHIENGSLYDANGSTVEATQPGYPVTGHKEGALVGKVGENGTPFYIGNGPTQTPENASGNLYLCINDDLNGLYGAGLTDNEGELKVLVTKS